MPIQQWFPTTLYVEELSAPPQIMEGMIDYVSRFYEKNKENYDTSIGLTGDMFGESKIHQKSTFSWLNKQIWFHSNEYLHALGADTANLKVYASKAWPVVMQKGAQVWRHRHKNSVLSAVFYLKTDDTSSGQIRFFDSTSPLDQIPWDLNPNPLSFRKCFYESHVNRLVVFPSSLEHEVGVYKGEKERYSLSYDIMITSNRNSSDVEMTIPDIREWRELG